MSGIPVVLSPNGLPVTPVASGAPLITVSPYGIGMPITIAPNATPFIIEGLGPRPLGPLDYADYRLGAFNNFSRNFDLASPSAVFGMVAHYSGDPVISIAHGGEPLTIVKQERNPDGIMSLIAVGTGLTIESAPLTINVTGGSVGGGAIRINEMVDIQPALAGWTDGGSAVQPPIPSQTMTSTSGGTVKIAYGASINDYSRSMRVIGATTTWEGYLTTGIPSATDFSPAGDWTLEAGWSWDGNDLVHTGPSSKARIPYIYDAPGRGVSVHAFAELEAGSFITMSPSASVSGNTVGGPLSHNVYGPMSSNTTAVPVESLCTITVRGNARLRDIGAMYGETLVSWVFASAPAVDGETLEFYITNRPRWVTASAEVLGQDY
jgi:hypothetical protein